MVCTDSRTVTAQQHATCFITFKRHSANWIAAVFQKELEKALESAPSKSNVHFRPGSQRSSKARCSQASKPFVVFEKNHKLFEAPVGDQAEAKITESCRQAPSDPCNI